MATAGGIRAGRAFVEIGGDESALARALDRALAKVKDFGRQIATAGIALAGLGTASVAGLLTLAKLSASAGSTLNNLSIQTGLAAEEISFLQQVAENAGASVEDVVGAFRNLNKGVIELASGSKSAVDSFAKLGLSYQKLSGRSTFQQFQDVADAIAQLPTPAARASAALDVFGKSGAKLLPILVAGGKGLADAQKRFEDLGLAIGAASAASVGEFDDLFNDIIRQLGAVRNVIGAAAAEVFIPIARAIQPILRLTIDWADKNRSLVGTILGVSAGAIALGGALVTLGVGVTLSSIAVGGLATAAGIILSPIAAATAAVGSFASVSVGLVRGFSSIGAGAAGAVASVASLAASLARVTANIATFNIGGAIATGFRLATTAATGLAGVLSGTFATVFPATTAGVRALSVAFGLLPRAASLAVSATVASFSLLTSVVGTLLPIIPAIATAAVGVVSSILPVLTAIGGAIATVISIIPGVVPALTAVSGVAATALATVTGAVQAALAFVTGFTTFTLGFIGGVAQVAVATTSTAVAALVGGIIPVVTSFVSVATGLIVSAFSVIPTAFAAVVSVLPPFAVTAGVATATALGTGLSTVVAVFGTIGVIAAAALSAAMAAVIPALTTAISAAVAVVATLLPAFAAVGTAIVGAVVGSIAAIIPAVTTVITALAAVFGGLIPLVAVVGVTAGAVLLVNLLGGAGRIKSGLAGFFSSIGTGIAGALNSAVSSIGEVFGGIATTVRRGFSAIPGIASTAFGGIKSFATSAADGVVSVFQSMASLGGQAFAALANIGSKAWDFISASAIDLGTTIKSVYDGAVNAFQAGKLELAGQIATTGIKLAWEQLKEFVSTAWQQTVTFVLEKGTVLYSGLLRGWEFLRTGISEVLLSIVNFARAAWSKIGAFAQTAFEGAVDFTTTALINAQEAVGLIDKATAKAQRAEAQRINKAKVDDIAAERERQLGGLDKEFEAQLKQSGKDLQAKLDQIDALQKELVAKIADRAAGPTSNTQAEIDRLKRELAELTQQAKDAANPPDSKKRSLFELPDLTPLDRIADKLKSSVAFGGITLKQALAATETTTQNRMLAASERTARATEDTATRLGEFGRFT